MTKASYKLIEKATGREVRIGDLIRRNGESLLHAMTYQNGEWPHREGAAGRIWVRAPNRDVTEVTYAAPSTFGLEWVRD